MEINMNQETLDKMTSLRLKGMFNAFKTSLETSQRESMTTDRFISWLILVSGMIGVTEPLKEPSSKLILDIRHRLKS